MIMVERVSLKKTVGIYTQRFRTLGDRYPVKPLSDASYSSISDAEKRASLIFQGKTLTNHFQGVLAQVLVNFATFSDAILKYAEQEEINFQTHNDCAIQTEPVCVLEDWEVDKVESALETGGFSVHLALDGEQCAGELSLQNLTQIEHTADQMVKQKKKRWGDPTARASMATQAPSVMFGTAKKMAPPNHPIIGGDEGGILGGEGVGQQTQTASLHDVPRKSTSELVGGMGICGRKTRISGMIQQVGV